jgi:hypothetical protein
LLLADISYFLRLPLVDNGCNNKVYYLSRHLKGDFMVAQSFCKNFGMNLAAFTTLNEYNNFKNVIFPKNLADIQNGYILVGATTIGSTNWYWLPDGTELNYPLNWAPNEPSNPTGEKCLSLLEFNGSILFNDVPCTTMPMRFICEKFL